MPTPKLPKGEFVQAQNIVADGPDNIWAAGVLTEGMELPTSGQGSGTSLGIVLKYGP